MASLRLVAACGLVFGFATRARADVEPRTANALDEDEELADKKTRWLADKADRADLHAAAKPPRAAVVPLSLRNLWTDEILPIAPDVPPARAQLAFDRLVRCHFTQVSTAMAPKLLPLIRLAAAQWKSPYVEIVSGYRAPKYQLMLRKKGHEVARDSAHPKGQAVDFRVAMVQTKQLLAFVRKQKLGGVGYYPDSRFVHADTGPIRYWKGH